MRRIIGPLRPRPPRRGPRAGVVALILVGLVMLTAACGSPSATAKSSHPASSAKATITIDNFSFSPSPLTVEPGQRVTVVNRTSVTHTLTSTTRLFNTGDIKGGTTTSFVAPTKPGRYPYLCLIHQYMTGVLIVSPTS